MTQMDQRRVGWRYTFCDLLTRTPLARLPLVGADLSEVIGGPAPGTGNVPISSKQVRARDPWTATTPRRTICFAQRVVTSNDREIAAPCLWAGIVWKRVRSGRSLALTMATPESYYAMRLAARNRTFARKDDALIQRQVFMDAEAVASGSIGLAYGDTLLGTRSDRTVATADLKTVLELAQSIAANGDGFEWRIQPGITPAGEFTLTLVQARKLGRSNVPGLLWVSAPEGRVGNELMGYAYTEDGTGVPNRVVGLGDGQPPSQLRSVTTAAQLGDDEVAHGWPLLEVALNSSTQGLKTQTSLNRHTRAELTALRRAERQITSLTVRGDRGPTVDAYGLGDTLTLRLNDPLHTQPLQLPGRLLARRIQPVEPKRTETVAMTLGPA